MGDKQQIQNNIEQVRARIVDAAKKAGRSANSVRLITVTKTYPATDAQAVLDAGCLDIGENRVQEIVEKVPLLTGTKTIHLIGHLQSNKVNKVCDLANWIHSVDSIDILRRINRRCSEIGKKINILVQVNTSAEESKSGCLPEEALSLCEEAFKCESVAFRGLMTIGPLHGDSEAVRASFKMLRDIGEKAKQYSADGYVELSMGMSGDFEMAIEEGATMVRVGSLILGEREYQ